MEGVEDPGKIGSDDREQARTLLRRHWEAHTLDPDEHEHRTTMVRNARTLSELEAATADLPALPAELGVVLASYDDPSAPGNPPLLPAADSGPTSEKNVPSTSARSQGIISLPIALSTTITALTPFLAFLLFFNTGNFLYFFLIPVVGILLNGTGSGTSTKKNKKKKKKRKKKKEGADASE
ncbi:DUF1707 SHOCT-like domain-containing protein [Austwickia chelonae]|uniref:DUF1707 SHOCT-like domain-containing protein n=1 Tax=Austwickia chelonae TaxID=100225 RepID=UPI000E259A96|nr:DUF1707 domain-containing protein [Austwickia chelonae]